MFYENVEKHKDYEIVRKATEDCYVYYCKVIAENGEEKFFNQYVASYEQMGYRDMNHFLQCMKERKIKFEKVEEN